MAVTILGSSPTLSLGSRTILPAASFDISGTPANHNFAVFADSDTIEGLDRHEYYVSRSSFLVLVTALNTSGVKSIIVVDEDVTVGANLTVNSNITLRFIAGKKITVTTSYVLTINGHVEANPYYQIFALSEAGAVSGTPKTEKWYPEWFGAVRDGSTDDQLPISYAAKVIEDRGGGVLHFHKGHYICKSYIYLTSNTIVEGEGMGDNGTLLESADLPAEQTYIYVKATTDGSVYYRRAAMFAIGIKTGSGAGSTTHVCESVSNVRISDLKINMNDDTIGYPLYEIENPNTPGFNWYATTTAILVEKAKYITKVYENIYVERVEFDYVMVAVMINGSNYGEGNPWSGGSTPGKNVHIENCRVNDAKNKCFEVRETDGVVIKSNWSNQGDGMQVHMGCKNVTIEGNHVLYSGTGIGITNYCKRASVANNHLEYVAPRTVDHGSTIGGKHIGIIIGYQISALYDGTSFYHFEQDDISITGNTVIDDVSADNIAFGFGTSQTPTTTTHWDMDGFSISNNTFRGDIQILPIGVTVPTSSYVSMTDILFSNNYVSGSIIADRALVADKITISNCVIGGATTINTASSGGIDFIGTFFKGNLTIGSNASNCSVINCTVVDGSTITVSGTTNKSINNNVIDNTDVVNVTKVAKYRTTYADDGDTNTIIDLDAGDVVWAIKTYVSETFDDSGADNLELGKTGDVDYYTGGAIDTTSLLSTGWVDHTDAVPEVMSGSTVITVKYSGGVSDASQGILDTFVWYTKY